MPLLRLQNLKGKNPVTGPKTYAFPSPPPFSCIHNWKRSMDLSHSSCWQADCNGSSIPFNCTNFRFGLFRGGARNSYLRGLSCSTNIFIKTTSHIHIYTCFFIIYTFFYLISYIYTHTQKKKKKKKSLVFSIKIMFDGNFS